MTLNRIVLRLAALAALSGFGRSVGPWPTLAKDQIFDSRIEPQNAVEGERPFPIAVIYTDYDKDFPKHSTLQGSRLVTVTFEILMVQGATIFEPPATPDGEPIEVGLGYDVPQTDGEMEISLDLFEAQVFNALAADNPAANCYKYLSTKVLNVISRRGASAEGGGRISARQITVEIDMMRDPLPGNLPKPIADFLDAFEAEYDGLNEKAAGLRSLYLADGDETAAAKMIGAMAWSNEAAEAAGVERAKPVQFFPPIVNYLDQNGRPF